MAGRQRQDQILSLTRLDHARIRQTGEQHQKVQDAHRHVSSRVRFVAHKSEEGVPGGGEIEALQAVQTARDRGRTQVRPESAGSVAAALVLLQGVRHSGRGRRGFWSRSGHRIACNCSPHIIRQTINVSSIGRRLDTKLHEQMKICVNSMLCLMARPQIHLPNVKTCLDVVNTYQQPAAGRRMRNPDLSRPSECCGPFSGPGTPRARTSRVGPSPFWPSSPASFRRSPALTHFRTTAVHLRPLSLPARLHSQVRSSRRSRTSQDGAVVP